MYYSELQKLILKNPQKHSKKPKVDTERDSSADTDEPAIVRKPGHKKSPVNKDARGKSKVCENSFNSLSFRVNNFVFEFIN